jgi:hypothetical protein
VTCVVGASLDCGTSVVPGCGVEGNSLEAGDGDDADAGGTVAAVVIVDVGAVDVAVEAACVVASTVVPPSLNTTKADSTERRMRIMRREAIFDRCRLLLLLRNCMQPWHER